MDAPTPRPLRTLVSHLDGVTAITRIWPEGARCRRCPRCRRVDGVCLVQTIESVGRDEAPDYSLHDVDVVNDFALRRFGATGS